MTNLPPGKTEMTTLPPITLKNDYLNPRFLEISERYTTNTSIYVIVKRNCFPYVITIFMTAFTACKNEIYLGD